MFDLKCKDLQNMTMIMIKQEAVIHLFTWFKNY